MFSIRRALRFAAGFLLLLSAPLARSADAPRPVTLDVDAREVARRILHARLVIPAAPGPLTLVYPKWVPGEHGPTGPITDLAGLKFSAGGKPLAWRRDPVDMWALNCDVPAGVDAVEVSLDYLAPAETSGFSSGASATSKLALISWNQLLLYPQGKNSDDIAVAATLTLPAGWKYGTALQAGKETAGRLEFPPVSLTTLVDSPVLTGQYFRTVTLTDGTPAHRIQIAADSAAALEMTPAHLAQFQALVAETGVLFGARHYRHYDFLLTLSDHTAHFGLEHHESSDDRVAERSLVDEDKRKMLAGLLPHEMTHSWNGKHRRPAGLATPNFQEPMKGELLWVYEGLTEYLGQILTARSGLLTPEQYREQLALTAATMDLQAGRSWRPLADTAVAAQLLYDARSDWAAWRRGVDFYPESELLWLEADALIRRQTQGKKSLDDFCRAFHGGASGPPKLVTYTFEDVVAELARIAPYDWAGFWKSRLEATQPRAPLGGIEAAGWKLAYTDALPEMLRAADEVNHTTDERFSIGIVVHEDGSIPDVIPNTPAARAGVGPGVKLVAVNGRQWSKDVLRDAIRATKSGEKLELLVENGDYFETRRLDYADGLRYPRLTREETRPDLLSQIIASRAAKTSK
jgi:predicted metalloprotease with PDZ domain